MNFAIDFLNFDALVFHNLSTVFLFWTGELMWLFLTELFVLELNVELSKLVV